MSTRSLAELGLDDLAHAGGKAARLGHLARAGFRVPDGFVIQAAAAGEDLRSAVAEGLARLGPGAVAVRSSGVSEDLASASFAGQFETILNVEGVDAVVAAVRRCRESAGSTRVLIYASERASSDPGPMAVLVQRMVQAGAAGVAYSANPITGDRGEVIISATRGLGDPLVGGETSPDEWVVRGDDAFLRAGSGDAIDARQARDVASLATSAASLLGSPQDIEWALADGDLFLLQARPITALPGEVSWECPMPRGFARHFRFGEWIGDPVTPLFESWLLTLLEEGLSDKYSEWFGLSLPRPFHVVLNGWYFYELPALPDTPRDLVAFLGSAMRKLLTRPRRLAMMIPPLAHAGIEDAVREWREVALPQHLAVVARAEAAIETASTAQLVAMVDEVARKAGVYFAYITLVAGFAAKAELPLARFYRRHLYPEIAGSHLELLQGLVVDGAVQAHSVLSLDWYFPTAGEMPGSQLADGRVDRSAARLDAEGRARKALAGRPALAAEFEKLLAVAQRFQPLREECVGHLTRGWPVMRRALERLGDRLPDAPDVHFLRREELVSALDGTLARPDIEERRTMWDLQRRLSPPLVIGPVAPMAAKMLADFVEGTRAPSSTEGIHGVAASPGRASGPVRIVRDLSEFELLMPGEVLVAPVTTPAWTPLFSRAIAVITDTGSIGSHASQVAREFGIPAVVCTGDATRRLRSGQLVSVDGGAGVVVVSGYKESKPDPISSSPSEAGGANARRPSSGATAS